MAKPARTTALQNGGTEHAALLAQASGLPKSALSQNLDSKAKVRHAPGQQRGWLRIDARGGITVVQASTQAHQTCSASYLSSASFWGCLPACILDHKHC